MNEATLRLVDTHAHLDEIEAVDEALREAGEAGVVAVIAVGQDYESNSIILELAAKHVGMVYPALGLHPWNLAAMDGGQVERTLHQIENNIETIAAIGEVGLDYHKKVRASVDKDRQQAVFRDVLEVASRHNKAVSIHTRYAWKDGFELVRASGVSKAVFHWYTGFSSVLREIIASGHFISATPAAEYHDDHRRAVKETPPESLLLETDSPVTYGREVRFQAQPRDTLRTLKAVARIKGLDEYAVAQATTANAVGLFGLSI